MTRTTHNIQRKGAKRHDLDSERQKQYLLEQYGIQFPPDTLLSLNIWSD